MRGIARRATVSLGYVLSLTTYVRGLIRSDYLCPGDRIKTHGVVTSYDNSFFLHMQNDGNMVIYENAGASLSDHAAIWSTATSGSNAFLDFQASNGHLMLYSAGSVLWSATESTTGDVYLRVQNDGNLVKYDDNLIVNK